MVQKIPVLLVDDHPVVRLGLSLILADSPLFTVCGEASGVSEARALTEQSQPAAIVLDLLLGGRDGIELIEDLLTLAPAARILIYSSQDEKLYARRALQAGARGYLMKTEPPASVAVALTAVMKGEYVVSTIVQQTVLAQSTSRRNQTPSLLELLSDRELQVLRMLGSGQRQGQIAEALSLSVKTVSTYRERLKDKLGCASGSELEHQAHEFARTGRLPPPVPPPLP